MSRAIPTAAARACRCCLASLSEGRPWLDLGEQPLANSYHRPGDPLPRFPLAVNFCRRCAHSQLSVVVPPEAMFTHYLYVSGTTETFRRHQYALARDAMARTLLPHPYVLDIACNDGSQLEAFRELGARVLGVDPARNLRPLTHAKGIGVLVEYWDRKAAIHSGGGFDIITATNVFAHVHEVSPFLKACRDALQPDGRLYIEFPYAAHGWLEHQFDQVYHEHLSYFLVKSFTILIGRHGWVIEDVIESPVHGGSIRFVLRKDSEPREAGEGLALLPHNRKVAALIERERAAGLHESPFYAAAAAQIRANGRELNQAIRTRLSQGRKVVGYGASAKGNTAMNAFKIDLPYVVDDNELKWGLQTPGRDIPIVAPETLAGEEGPLTVLVLAWNFGAEIARKVGHYRPGQDTELLFYVPAVYSQTPAEAAA